MDHLPLIAVLVFVLGVALPMIFRLFRRGPRDKARIVVEYAQKKGYVLLNPAVSRALDTSFLEMMKNPALRDSVQAISDVRDIEGLEHATGGWLAFKCSMGLKEATIFTASVTGATRGGGGYPVSIAKIGASGLPRFSLGHNSAFHTLEDAVEKIAGAPLSRVQLNAAQYPEFSAHFWVRGSDPDAVTAFLSPERIRFLEGARLAGVLATNASYLVYFEDGALLTEADFDSFIARVQPLAARFAVE